MRDNVMRKTPDTSSEFVALISKAFEASPPEGLEDSVEELRAAGLDPAAVGREIAEFAKAAYAVSPLNWRVSAARERTAALERLGGRHVVPRPRAELETQINAILAQGGKAAAEVRAYFHKNQGRASDEDLASLLSQLEFLAEEGGEDE